MQTNEPVQQLQSREGFCKNSNIAPDHLDDLSFADWLRFTLDRAWSIKTKLALLEQFDDPSSIYRANPQLFKEEIFKEEALNEQSTHDGDKAISKSLALQIAQHIEWLKNPNHHFIHLTCPNYPKELKEIATPPIALFAIGNLDLLNSTKIAIVGNRRPTPIGANAAKLFGKELAEQGICVVSGLALGIDACAHQGALKTQSNTIAVMGCGLDSVYPSRHRHLHESITKQGLVLSEFPLTTPAKRHHFPQRNRIISGLSTATLIVEAAQKSGTLLTARLAVEQNREVLVLPGSINSPNYQGSHALIREGATLVTSANDILASLPNYVPGAMVKADESLAISDQAHQILDLLDGSASSSDMILNHPSVSLLDYSQLSVVLLELEMSGLIAQDERGYYTKIDLS